MAERASCSFAAGQICDFSANIVGLVVNVCFIVLEVTWPTFAGPSHIAVVIGHSAWAISAALIIVAICTQRQYFTYFGVAVQLLALVAFSYFVVLNASVHWIIILTILLLWWIVALVSVVIGKWGPRNRLV